VIDFTFGQFFGIMPSIYDWVWVPVYILLAIFIYSNFIILFQGYIQERMYITSETKVKAEFKTIAFNFILDIALTIIVLFIPSILIGQYFITMFLIPIALIHLLTSIIATISYSKTRDLVQTAIITGIFPALMFSTLSPFIWIGLFF